MTWRTLVKSDVVLFPYEHRPYVHKGIPTRLLVLSLSKVNNAFMYICEEKLKKIS